MNQIALTHSDVKALCYAMIRTLDHHFFKAETGMLKVYPIPRGGIPVAYLLKGSFGIEITDNPAEADLFIDDIIDSGATYERYANRYPGVPFIALIDKRDMTSNYFGKWVTFPWEVGEKTDDHSMSDSIIRLLQFIGEDPKREGLIETSSRVVKAWQHWAGGYSLNPAEILKVFEDGAENYDQMVTVKEIPFYSHCEHHLAPFFGTASISYIPNGRIVGLSKLSRLVDAFSRRLQVQERLTNQLADALMENLSPLGVGVHIKARHLCMESRGICQQGHHTETTALRGVIKEDVQARSEFLGIL